MAAKFQPVQRLKPHFCPTQYGTAEAVPYNDVTATRQAFLCCAQDKKTDLLL
jgi:hypothetical protein